jgi:hypothetical protein
MTGRAATSEQRRGPDFGFVRAFFARYWLAIWFGIISLIRLQSLVTGSAGFDAQLYLKATRAWLDGADPWVFIDQQRFAAPPPTLIPLAPIAILPEQLGIAIMIALAVVGAIATVRLLHLPWWWLLFPPFIDAAWNGNPQNLLVPLILVGAGPLAAFLKIYAIVPIALTLRWRTLLVTAVLLVVTAPFLPWASYIAQFGELSAALAEQSDGGLSATAIPWLIPVAVVALLFVGRERAAWLAVPALWPTTQWYYSTLAVPAATPLAGAILAVPLPGAAVVATIAVAIHRRNTSVQKLVADWIPGRAGGAGHEPEPDANPPESEPDPEPRLGRGEA